ncbi:MAG TPA: LysR family transcriptional regulator [Gemmatimonadaceae bacterium]|jgi:DNA-binding transcriptional LysR family regulator|nr:LysR family transcriptional regulator [Gemmatimonadaceae bacterium]
MNMNPASLRAFAAVAETGGFTAAARALGVSQPAVSRAVRDLERSVGFELLERAPKGIRLTRAGESFLLNAREVIGAMRSAEESVVALGGLGHGRLHIGASTTIATYVLPVFIGKFLEQHPAVDVRLDSAHTRGIAQMLLDYHLDIAITEAPVSHEKIQSRRWRTDHLVAVASPKHPLATRRRIPPSALAIELLLLRERESGTRAIVLAGLAAAGVMPGRTMEIDGPEAIKQIAAAGRGIAIVSRYTVVEQLELGRLVALDIPGLKITRPFYRLSLKQRRASPAAKAFEGLLDDDDGEG